MAIKVLFFGPLAEIAGGPAQVEEAATLKELEQLLLERYPALKYRKYAYAVDEQLVNGDLNLTDGVTVALLPPFSGG